MRHSKQVDVACPVRRNKFDGELGGCGGQPYTSTPLFLTAKKEGKDASRYRKSNLSNQRN